MIKILKMLAILALVALIVIQFIPRDLNESQALLPTDFIATYNPPKQVERILLTSCYDCHSNNTEYPWYNKIQPVAMYLEDHIRHGKGELNFSEFGDYSLKRKDHKLEEIVEEVKNNKMPLESYTFIHRDAIISSEEKAVLFQWVDSLLTTNK